MMRFEGVWRWTRIRIILNMIRRPKLAELDGCGYAGADLHRWLSQGITREPRSKNGHWNECSGSYGSMNAIWGEGTNRN